jgi:hypothetical protein
MRSLSPQLPDCPPSRSIAKVQLLLLGLRIWLKAINPFLTWGRSCLSRRFIQIIICKVRSSLSSQFLQLLAHFDSARQITFHVHSCYSPAPHKCAMWSSHSTNISELSLQPKLREFVFHYWHVTAVFSNVVFLITEYMNLIFSPTLGEYHNFQAIFHVTRTFKFMVLQSLTLRLAVY